MKRQMTITEQERRDDDVTLVHYGDGTSLVEREVDELEGRIAHCVHCRTERPSSTELPFFEYLGEGSRQATESCLHCRYSILAHEHDDSRVVPTSRVERGECPGFEPLGDVGQDRFYCGCRGWD